MLTSPLSGAIRTPTFRVMSETSTCPPRLRRGDLRQALIDYAMEETRAGHVETMSLRAAARDLGVSSGAVYRHFDDKDALLVEIASQGVIHMRDAFHEIRPEGDTATEAALAVARAFRMSRKYVHFAHEMPTLWRMMFGRIGMMCREGFMADTEFRRYTSMDVVRENMMDLHRLGVLSRTPELQDVRFFWSAVHGAADLAQCGARLDGAMLDFVADDTTRRSLRAIGCPDEIIETWDIAAGPAEDCMTPAG